MKALIVVDVQNDFLEGGALAVAGGLAIIPLINRLIPVFDTVVYTQDWHPPGHKSFASAHPGAGVYERIPWLGDWQVLWPDHCVQNSPGAAFHETLRMADAAVVIQKGCHPEVDSYSGFYDNQRRQNTGMAAFLRKHNINHVYICGLAADYCVKYTALDAVDEGFRVTLVADATRAVNQQAGDFERALKQMQDAGVEIVYTNDLLN